MTAIPKISSQRFQKAKDIITWTAPTIFIPTIRFIQDPPERRKELFARDFTTYSVGAAIYFIAGLASKKILNKTNLIKGEDAKNFTSFIIAIASNILYAGIGAIKISKHFKNQSENKKLSLTVLAKK